MTLKFETLHSSSVPPLANINSHVPFFFFFLILFTCPCLSVFFFSVGIWYFVYRSTSTIWLPMNPLWSFIPWGPPLPWQWPETPWTPWKVAEIDKVLSAHLYDQQTYLLHGQILSLLFLWLIYKYFPILRVFFFFTILNLSSLLLFLTRNQFHPPQPWVAAWLHRKSKPSYTSILHKLSPEGWR